MGSNPVGDDQDYELFGEIVAKIVDEGYHSLRHNAFKIYRKNNIVCYKTAIPRTLLIFPLMFASGLWVGKPQMSIHYVSFLPSSANFCTAFIKNSDTSESLEIDICLRIVIGGKQGHAPSKIHSLQNILSLRQ